MCGIAGFNWNDEKLLDDFKCMLRHRGPDQEGRYIDKDCSIIHTRLSILDLSERGKQPMMSKDGNTLITFNGEIFNYKELRAKMTAKGHKFLSGTDTEVLLSMYLESGPDFLEQLNGQFAFCIYDKVKQTFFIARDRVGIIPLFYYCIDKKFIFSSEMKCIMSAGINKVINEEALVQYFRFGYIPAPLSILNNVYKLEPAHYMIYDNRCGRITTYKRYWDYGTDNETSDFEKASRMFYDEIKKAALIRLRADVPVGAFLSGGIDSSAIASLVRAEKDDLKTFSVTFEYKEYDEGKYARAVAKRLKTEHYEVKLLPADIKKIIPELPVLYDEPMGDPSSIPTMLISRFARKYVTVCLSGDGADELLGGYNRYGYFYILKTLNKLPVLLKRLFRIVLKPIIFLLPVFELERIYELLGYGKLPDLELYEKLVEKINRDDLSKLLKKEKLSFKDTTAGIKPRKGLKAIQQYDIIRYLEGDILTKVDRAAMSVNLETRPPFLDHRLITMCMNISDDLKIRGRSRKRILKKAFRGILPDEVINRKKQGFSVPLKHYLKNEFIDLVEKYVFNYDRHGLFDRDFLKDMSSGHIKKDVTRLYWNVIIFNMWHEKWL